MASIESPGLKIIDDDERVTHVALRGRLDTEGVGAVELAFTGRTAALRRPTIVDLSEVDFLASLGMGMLVRAARSLGNHQAGLVLLNPREPVERALRAAQIDVVTPIARDHAEALRLLRL